jgi:hypothetical protein
MMQIGCVQFTNCGCTNTNARPVNPVSGGNKTECAQSPIQTLTATATVASGANIVWYDAPTGGNTVANPILNTIGTKIYYAEASNTTSSCKSCSYSSYFDNKCYS